MAVLRLAHVEVGVNDLAAASDFYVGSLGFIEHARDGRSLYLRAPHEFDRWSLCLTEVEEPGVRHYCFRVSDPDDLDWLMQLHEMAGLPARRVPPGTEPDIGAAIRVLTPDGHPVEFAHEIGEVSFVEGTGIRIPLRNTQTHRGPGITRLDHVNFRVLDLGRTLAYWQQPGLEFSVSEMVVGSDGRPVSAWLRRRTGTHDLALATHELAFMHHFAYYMEDRSAIVAAADLMGDLRRPDAIERGPGRHGVSNALYLYVRDPSGNRIELFHGDYSRDLDRPAITWNADDFRRQGSNWWGVPAPPTWTEGIPIVNDGWTDASSDRTEV